MPKIELNKILDWIKGEKKEIETRLKAYSSAMEDKNMLQSSAYGNILRRAQELNAQVEILNQLEEFLNKD